jgi:hypothetical protein
MQTGADWYTWEAPLLFLTISLDLEGLFLMMKTALSIFWM